MVFFLKFHFKSNTNFDPKLHLKNFLWNKKFGPKIFKNAIFKFEGVFGW